ncbi:hypothetical protein A3731_11885 [Roseovarius sp. HI0049]|nr:hypothetical protein A3731_11885 [Roseovarius sp. HI0049]
MGNLFKHAQLFRNLAVFEAASRSDNFTRVAEEIGVSRVAVSRQISELEAALGQKLFVRGHRSVELTAAGEALQHAVNPALQTIADALDSHRSAQSGARVSVTVTSAFATYWLMPRLIDFGAHHPDIEVNLVVSDRYLDLSAENIDIAVRYLPENMADANWQPLLRERIFPVYSPRYRANTNLSSASDLLQERLLYLSGRYRDEARWGNWFQTQKLHPPEERTGVHVNTYINMLQAAIEGQGVALAGHPLVDSYLESGTLKKVDGIEPLVREYFYVNKINQSDGAVAVFSDWLMQKARE